MEDENGIELSLGLSCGGSSSKSKVKDSLVDSAEGSRSRPVFEPSLKPFIPPPAQITDLFKHHREGKRKLPLEEMISHKKPEKAGAFRGHVSLREEGPSAELDDTGESEAEGSSSKGVDQEQGSVDHGKSTYEKIPLTLQGLPVRGGGPGQGNGLGFSSRCGMQVMPSLQQPMIHQAFGYSSVQLPSLETHSSWIFGGVNGNVKHLENGSKISSAQHSEGMASEAAQAGSKHAEEVAGTSISAHIADEPRPTNGTGGLPLEMPGIKPGIAADLMFGGSGSKPDLPWVSTTGPGPNGKTISGVTYKFSPNQVKIVCACHGSHMTPEEFIQHASAVPSENHGSSNHNSVAPS